MTKIADLTKGKTLVNRSGQEFTILSKKFQSAGTVNRNDEANYVGMVRPEGGRGFDLFVTESSLVEGDYRLK
ncbi:hypothetical protein SEA_MAMAPEARL_32 [Arthrobacter phage MamaPearl]|uniref:Uncharacterized protein n=3 Tax=Korravirus TaxID=1982076 RepID=A0A386K9L6_9CAUD|nr:hypothetical protein KDJ03_gp32 [Arthrobacter phage MamaPearl]AYD81727.1 hypothetical protein Moki_31 [Arthrobacter phage Moki]AZS08172.1 hypothetical protein SEA_HUCKLEBERRY_31 [Arthrobacter phage Huckleberry]QDH48220.1 hypothetical protein SEA_ESTEBANJULIOR_32 [Arthrobacter phage EstebanJulior]QKY79102.1 hypothetical protein SEA_MAMAPEARL_32 [Arthrobacter phage MamaPearl]